MEFERMGFDVTLLALVVLGNTILVVGGAFLVALLSKVVKRWERDLSGQPYLNTDADDYVSTCEMPVSQEQDRESSQPARRPVFVQTPVHAAA